MRDLLLDARSQWLLLDLVRQTARGHRTRNDMGCFLGKPENACRFCKSVAFALGSCRCKQHSVAIVSGCPVHGVTPGGSYV